MRYGRVRKRKGPDRRGLRVYRVTDVRVWWDGPFGRIDLSSGAFDQKPMRYNHTCLSSGDRVRGHAPDDQGRPRKYTANPRRISKASAWDEVTKRSQADGSWIDDKDDPRRGNPWRAHHGDVWSWERSS